MSELQRVLLVHNHYQRRGGEDVVFEAEAALLEAHGHDVDRFTVHNDAFNDMGPVRSAAKAVWNRRAAAELRDLIRRRPPDVVHFHNTFPLLSPAALWVAHAEGVPVVKTLHNYRLMCLNGLLLRHGTPCETCVGRPSPWPGVLRSCYRESRSASTVAALSLSVHRAIGSWTRCVDLFVAPSQFTREMLVRGGLPPTRVRVKPHFVSPDPGRGPGGGGYALFVGRLSPEKGLNTLLEAWRGMPNPLPLRVVGDGPLAGEVRAAAHSLGTVECRGELPQKRVAELLGDAAFLVVPSLAYETFGRVVIEAFAAGTPVVAPAAGAFAELLEGHQGGSGFRAGDPEDLVRAVDRLTAPDPGPETRRRAARSVYEERFTPAESYSKVIEIYRDAKASRVVSGTRR